MTAVAGAQNSTCGMGWYEAMQGILLNAQCRSHSSEIDVVQRTADRSPTLYELDLTHSEFGLPVVSIILPYRITRV